MKIKKHTITHAIKYIFLSLLLALPFIAMLPSTFYYAFNQNAQDNTANEVNITYQYQTNEVNTIDDLIIGNIYSYKVFENVNFTNIVEYYMQNNDIYDTLFNTYNQELNNANLPEVNDIYTEFNMPYNTTFSLQQDYYVEQTLRYKINTINNINNYIALIYHTRDTIIKECDFILTEDIKQAFIYNIEDGVILLENLNKYIKPSTYLGEENMEIVEHDLNNQNAFYYASSQVFNKPLFNWVKNSIFVVPIMGMLGIFGISEMNFISSLLVYWVNILSIYAILNIILLVVEKLGSFGKRKNE